ncbi:MAG: 50S ribosomal protein L17 [Planctomycetota bacterium]|jgi:large subunit ribosomal protein L17
MRHLRAGRKLNADTQHRTAMRRNLARSLFLNGRITTTMAKAKATRPYVEKLVTRARRAIELKEKDRAAYIHQLRLLRREISDRKVLALLVNNIAPLCRDRQGGYTRILRDAKNQLGDNAPRAIWEFVDRPETGADEEAEAAAAKKGKGRKAKAAKAGK